MASVALCLVVLSGVVAVEQQLHLTTDNQPYATVIHGFATQMQCVLNTCNPHVKWYKEDVLLFNGTKRVEEEGKGDGDSFFLQHKVDVDHSKECGSACSASSPCAEGSTCVDNLCCPCSAEHFTLVIKNLTFSDSGRYKCQFEDTKEILEFQVEVLESGLHGGFHENISYDHSVCCREKGISPLCQSMCKPSDMAVHHFDPTSCKTDDFKNFLHCATEGGKRSHVHCCKTLLVPSFCYDLCSADFTMLRRAHRLCLYYLPEIFDCYNRAYLPFPDAPEEVSVSSVQSDQLQVCWKPPTVQRNFADHPVVNYTVFYKQIPNFPSLGGDDSIPFLSGDYADDPLGTDLDYTSETEKEKRKKRQTWVFITNDNSTNTSTVRQFTFNTLNTSDTCALLTDLRAATRYIVYVVGRNDYGASVPSVRVVASTNIEPPPSNGSLPDAMQCCVSNGVSSYCASKMCAVQSDPSSTAVIAIATSCRHEWSKVSPCIADGRNHTGCCERKGVQHDCLNICSGSTAELGVHSILCLNLDLAAIYQCLREGYEIHPSPPQNVSVHEVSDSSAVFTWNAPSANAHLVQSFTLFLRRNEHAAPIRRVENAVSPHVEFDLHPDTSYAVSVQSIGMNGTSLPSTTILFHTLLDDEKVCMHGDPLYMNNGKPYMCGEPSSPCPVAFTCTPTEDDEEAFCCPDEASLPTSFQDCCRKMGVSDDCLSVCTHNASSTLPSSCSNYLNEWIRCASDGHDHSRCCLQEEVKSECIGACRPPFTVNETCWGESSKLATCFSQHSSRLPSSVRNLQVEIVEENGVTLTWEHTNDVDLYQVQVFLDNSLNRTNTTSASLHITGLIPNREYKARVIAFNAAGASPPSFNVSFTSIAPAKDDHPKAPRRMRIEWNKGTQVNVSWEGVTQREDGTDLPAVQYTLYFMRSTKPETRWQTVRTNNTWAVMNHLQKDELYTIYVEAEELGAKISAMSNIIAIIAQPDSFGVPEPELSITPESANGVYNDGDDITIRCSYDPKKASSASSNINVDLNIDEHVTTNEPGESFVSEERKVNESLNMVTCTVSTTDGRQAVEMKRILVKYGPRVRMEGDRKVIRAHDDLTAQITCVAEGYPTPIVHFEYEGEEVKDEVRMRTRGVHSIAYTLMVNDAKRNTGTYTCVGKREQTVVRSDVELVASTQSLPVNPRLVLECCEKGGVVGECMDVCTIGQVRKGLNCTPFASQLISCANDNRDHGDCCAAKGVSSKCLSLCSGDSYSPESDCGEYAAAIMSCYVLGHESAPDTPTNYKYKVLGDGKIKLAWDSPSESEQYVFYGVYYKKLNEDSDNFKMVKTVQPEVELQLEPSSAYDVGVTAVNDYGHSPLAFFTFMPRETAVKESGWSLGKPLGLLLLVLLCAVGLAFVARRYQPALLPSFCRPEQGVRAGDASVAFENPGYNNGMEEEVEIRGMGSVSANQWHDTELRVGGSGGEGNGKLNGYSKMKT